MHENRGFALTFFFISCELTRFFDPLPVVCLIDLGFFFEDEEDTQMEQEEQGQQDDKDHLDYLVLSEADDTEDPLDADIPNLENAGKIHLLQLEYNYRHKKNHRPPAGTSNCYHRTNVSVQQNDTKYRQTTIKVLSCYRHK